jgi:hypothetical protein
MWLAARVRHLFSEIAEAGRENINSLLLREAGVAVDKRQKPTLIIGDCCLPPKLDQLARPIRCRGGVARIAD